MEICGGMGCSSALHTRISTARPEAHTSPALPTSCRQTSTSKTGGSNVSSVRWRTPTHDSNIIANPSWGGYFHSDTHAQQSPRVRVNGGASPLSGLDSEESGSFRESCSLERSSPRRLRSTTPEPGDALPGCTTSTGLSLAVGPDGLETSAGDVLIGSSHVFSERLLLYSMPASHSRAMPTPPTIALAPAVMSAEPSAPKPPDPEDRRKADDFYVNVGDAIRTLRRELPTIFSEDLSCKYPSQLTLTILSV